MSRNRHRRVPVWLKHARREGLVVAPAALSEAPIAQTAEDSEAFVRAARSGFGTVAREILGWPDAQIVTAETLCPALRLQLPELGAELRCDLAVTSLHGNARLLVRDLGDGDPDAARDFGGWTRVSEQQAFERHLRDRGVLQGLLVTDTHYRLTYAPDGEMAGYLEWPIEGLGEATGRDMLGAFRYLLGRTALHSAPDDMRALGHILSQSRRHQNNVSERLAEQMVGALYALMRGFTEADGVKEDLAGLLDTPARRQQVYEGLLAVLMRVIFVLFAEDRGLMPSEESELAKDVYESGYSVRGAYAQLLEDSRLYPDTMDKRYGAWGRLMGLFSLIHKGAGGIMVARGGKLFDPDAYPFLRGVFRDGQAPQIMPVSDKTVLDVLRSLIELEGETLSYKTLDVEEIGSVYETVMGFEVIAAGGASIAITHRPKAGAPSIPVFVDLDALLKLEPGERKAFVKDTTGYDPTAAVNRALKAAQSRAELIAAFGTKVDKRGSPDGVVTLAGDPVLQPTEERRRTGSHYTPRALTQPIVDRALAPVLDALGEMPKPDAILGLRVCDPAVGSGAFLVEACRRLGAALKRSWDDHPQYRPREAHDDPDLYARRLVARQCLYGVDLNPMAADLAKLSIWLVTLARQEDFTFLDHSIRVGNSLVGLSTEQIKAVTWENDAESLRSRALFTQAFEAQLDAALETRNRIRHGAGGGDHYAAQGARLAEAVAATRNGRLVGDAVVAAFFSEAKAKARHEALVAVKAHVPLDTQANADALAHAAMMGRAGAATDDDWAEVTRIAATLSRGPHPITPFHWGVEFPEVFSRRNPGFDCIVGNPPFAGKNTVAAGTRDGFADWLKVISPGAHGNADLAAHFYRRAYGLLREGGTFGLIATNTIAQGDTRESGLRYLLQEAGGHIYAAERRVKWPGLAAVVVSTVHMRKGTGYGTPQLSGQDVDRISAYLRKGDLDDTPAVLEANKGIAFQGSIILGMGFTFDDKNAEKGKCEPLSTMHALIEKDPRNAERIKPYLGGSEVNTHPEHLHHRYVIDFEDFPLRRDAGLESWESADEAQRTLWLREGVVPEDYTEPVAADWPDLLEIVERRVKPERDKLKDRALKRDWWLFARRRTELHSVTADLSNVYVLSRVSNHMGYARQSADYLFADSCVVFTEDTAGFLQSRVHEIWARLLSSSMKDDLRYSPSDCYQNFAPPARYQTHNQLQAAAGVYMDYRASVLIENDEGMTDTYRRFHDPQDSTSAIVRLRELHADLDDAVLRAYGWDDLAELARGEFAPRHLPKPAKNADGEWVYDPDVEYDPEHAYQGRYFWPAEFRDQVLERLLALNTARVAEEREQARQAVLAGRT